MRADAAATPSPNRNCKPKPSLRKTLLRLLALRGKITQKLGPSEEAEEEWIARIR
jgi:hypothetical protein